MEVIPMETTRAVADLDLKVFDGPNQKQMPKLAAAGFVPANAAQIMRGRLEGKLDWYCDYDSSNVILYHPDGDPVKLVWDSEDLLRNLTSRSVVRRNALVVHDGAWDSIDGEVFSMTELAISTSKRQPKERTKHNLLWHWLANDDRKLLGEYVDAMFARVKAWRGCYNEAMGASIDNACDPDRATVLRLWCLGGVSSNRGGAYCGIHTGYDGRLVGVNTL